MIIRQGDILLIRKGDAKAGTGKAVIIGHGEVTGHKHTLECAERITGDDLAWQLFANTGEWNGDDVPLVNVPAGTKLVHDEHNTLAIPAGVYEIRRQREYQPERQRYVID